MAAPSQPCTHWRLTGDVARDRWGAGNVGNGHRGLSRGWTMCPVPGHSGGTEGVIAMRRVAVIVALGALLGMLGGAVTTSPALADGRGNGWQFMSLPPTFTVDPVFCGFEIQGTTLVNKGFVKALKTADGSMAFLTTGAAKVSLTNPANGKTITANISGPIKEIAFPDGSVTFVGKGHQFNLLAPADAARFGLPGFFVSAGGLTLAVGADGTITSLSMDGNVLVDMCAALS